MIFTQSSTSKFRACRKAYFYRYVDQIESNAPRAACLEWGAAWDAIMNAWYSGDKARAYALSDAAGPEHAAALIGYDVRYQLDNLSAHRIQEVIAAAIGDDTFQGVADMIARDEDGRLWMLDNKSSSRIDAGRLDLWADWQLTLYCAFLEPIYGEFSGAIHNIVEKPTIKRKLGETDDEFAARRAEAKAPNRCRQSVADTDEEWATRLAAHYQNPAKFHREVVYFSRSEIERAKDELFQVVADIHLAHAENRWYRSPNMCRQYGSVCEYLPLCRSGDNPIVRETQFHHKPAHSEVINATTGQG